MTIWLRIEADPPVALIRDASALPYVDCDVVYPRLVSLGQLRRPLSRPPFASAEAAHLQAAVDNADGVLSREFADPPLGAAVSVMDANRVVFAGVLTDLALAVSGSLTIEGGGARGLSRPIPLRMSSVWGTYDAVQALPHGYGRVTLRPIQYSQDRRRWLLLDHPIQGVDAVRRDEVSTAAWAWRNTVDSTGHAVAVLELAEPLADGEDLAVDVRGKLHPDTGALIDRPADILADVAGLCGWSISSADLVDFAGETAHIELGGVLDDPARSCRAQLDLIMAAVGAAWSAGQPGVAMVWPPADSGAEAVRVDRLTATGLRPTASDAAVASRLVVTYDHDWSAGQARRAIALEAVGSRVDRELVLSAPWLHSPRLAEALGRRVLADLARPAWTVEWSGQWSTDVAPGDWVEIDHPISPVSGRHALTRSDLDMDRGVLTQAVAVPVGPVPAIEIAQLSTEFAPLIQAGAVVDYRDGTATLTIQDATGQRLAGALVTLDGQAQRITSASGQVTFSAPRGPHVVVIEAAGYQPMTVEVLL